MFKLWLKKRFGLRWEVVVGVVVFMCVVIVVGFVGVC